MPASKLVGLLFDAWDDLDRALAGVEPADAVHASDGSSFAWTAGHLANHVNTWINVRFAGRESHPLVGPTRFRAGGTGEFEDWPAVQAAVAEVREAARAYLEPLTDSDLDLVIPYDGTFAHLRESGLPLRHALYRICAHHYFHIGEIATKRDALGHDVGDYPGHLMRTV
ncbi:MAG: DinB family protein [Dehalococcoidia bacterium]